MSALVSQYTQHCFDKRHFADSGGMCFDIVILRLVLALPVLAQERPQHLIHVRLSDQVSLYNNQICRPQFLKSPEGPGKL